MRTPAHTGQFRRDIRRAQKRGKDMSKLRDALTLLLLYKIDGDDLILARTGSHADLFR